MNRLSLSIIAILIIFNTGASLAQANLWQDVTPQAKSNTDTSSARYFDSDDQALRNLLSLVPGEVSGQTATIDLPMPDGSLASFSIVESPIMEAGLAEKYPQIKTYKVYGIDDPIASGRVDITDQGLHAMLQTSQGRIFLDPDTGSSASNRYLARTRDANQASELFYCSAGEMVSNQSNDLFLGNKIVSRIPNSYLKYRLAVSATWEYAVAVNSGGSLDADAITAIIVAINRVNQIYERDLGIRLILVANTGALIDDGLSSPFVGFDNDGLQLLSDNKAWIESSIGVGDYDIGHVFSTGGGGRARLASVCDSTLKAQGVTGLPDPTGDLFYIDYVSHEIGHQFGAEHTFNGTTSNCFGANRIALNAFEPGSGSTLMAYAGICGAESIQASSDATFHSKSIEQINSFVSAAGNCPSGTDPATNPNEPVAIAGVDRVIPTGTPFLLQGSGTDSDGDTLSYQWDQIDAGTATDFTTFGDDLGDNALIRTYVPQSTGDRDIPALGTQVLDGPFDLAEALPCTARDVNMRLTVRDGKSGQDFDDLKLTVNANSGPFKITSHTTAGGPIPTNSPLTLTWDPANTNNAPISCAKVDIDLLTFAGGHATYGITSLATDVLNNGTYAFSTLPDKSASIARFRVSCRDNIFYDISDADLVIDDSSGVGGPFDTVANTTFFNQSGLTFAASAGNCSSGAVIGGGGGGSFAEISSGNSIFGILWLIILPGLLLGVSIRRVRIS